MRSRLLAGDTTPAAHARGLGGRRSEGRGFSARRRRMLDRIGCIGQTSSRHGLVTLASAEISTSRSGRSLAGGCGA